MKTEIAKGFFVDPANVLCLAAVCQKSPNGDRHGVEMLLRGGHIYFFDSGTLDAARRHAQLMADNCNAAP